MKENPVIFSLFGHDALVNLIKKTCHFHIGQIIQHQFPDDETGITIDSNVNGRTVIFVASLDRPNSKLIPLLFAAETARGLGASKIILIAPYLPYMRQDKVFEPGQGITSKYFARLISSYFDDLITLDPHLHRWHTLSSIYNIPSHVLHTTDNIAFWIQQHVKKPLLIGPDVESKQWVRSIAEQVNAPYLVLKKYRTGDDRVQISISNIEQYHDCIPVLVDDIISTGTTMIETLKHLTSLNMPSPICMGIHAVFAHEAYQLLLASGVKKVITCNTIPHVSNGIDISNNIIEVLNRLLDLS